MNSQNDLIQKQEILPIRNQIDISFQRISYSVKVEIKREDFTLPCNKEYEDKMLLKEISGNFKSGQISAIMGASGAGKTTLLNVLACRINPLPQGKLLANSTEYTHETFGDFANYVMQNDVLMQTLTVRETLWFAANLKLNDPQEIKTQKVNYLIKKLKLQKCLDTLVGGTLLKGTSGGQKKRTSIAFELISDPQVIFLDEPTSGLDSLTSYIIVKHLKSLCQKQGKTVIMTIHQPNTEIFEQFDKLILMVEGKLIYQGSARSASQYFASNFRLQCGEFQNPADYFMSIMHHEDIANKQRYPQYFAKYDEILAPQTQKNIDNRKTTNIVKRSVEVPLLTSYGQLVKRDFINIIRNPLLVKARIFQTIVMAVYTGGAYFGLSKDYTNIISWRALTGFFFFISVNVLMMALAPVGLVFPLERPVFLKEENAKLYGVGAYFISRNLLEIPYTLIIPLIYVLIIYWMVGLTITAAQFFIFYLILVLLIFNGSSLGLLLGSIITDPRSVAAVMPLVILPFVLFSGFFKNFSNLPSWIGWVEYISPIKYTFTAFVDNELNNAPNTLVGQLNFDTTLWQSIGLLAAVGMAFRMATLFFLWLLKTRVQ